MMPNKILSPGRAFEEEVFGVPVGFGADLGQFTRPEYVTWQESLQHIIMRNWMMYAESVRKGDNSFHDPTRPRMGKTHSIWSAVKNGLPGAQDARYKLPLNLYIAIGRNSFDHYHGVDALFWWQGVYATIDASVFKRNPEQLKAHFLLTPNDLEHHSMIAFGKRVAEFLVTRSLELRDRESKLMSG